MKSVVESGNGLRLIISELRRELEALYGERLAQLILFGSHARGQAGAESDIDVLVLLKGPVNVIAENSRTGELIANLSLRHDTLLSCVFMSEERFQTEHSPLLINVRREGVAI
jgi:uncharacterized protein